MIHSSSSSCDVLACMRSSRAAGPNPPPKSSLRLSKGNSLGTWHRTVRITIFIASGSIASGSRELFIANFAFGILHAETGQGGGCNADVSRLLAAEAYIWLLAGCVIVARNQPYKSKHREAAHQRAQSVPLQCVSWLRKHDLGCSVLHKTFSSS